MKTYTRIVILLGCLGLSSSYAIERKDRMYDGPSSKQRTVITIINKLYDALIAQKFDVFKKIYTSVDQKRMSITDKTWLLERALIHPPKEKRFFNGYKNVIHLLIKGGAKIDDMSWDGLIMFENPIFVKMVSFLTEVGVNINTLRGFNGGVFHWMAVAQSAGKIGTFLDAGADINLQNQDGDTPLHCSVQGANDYDCAGVRLLLVRGAKKGIRNKTGQTALDIAQKKGCPKVIKLLQAESGVSII